MSSHVRERLERIRAVAGYEAPTTLALALRCARAGAMSLADADRFTAATAERHRFGLVLATPYASFAKDEVDRALNALWVDERREP